MSKVVPVEYGLTSLDVELPDHAVVVEPGRTYEEPPPVDPVEQTRNALKRPMGFPPIRGLVERGSHVAIAFPDQVKGGTHAGSHRKTTLPLVLEELEHAGVSRSRIDLVCAMGLHRKNTREEMARYLPADVLKDFGPDQLVNHDAEDPDGVVDLGTSKLGDAVHFNRRCAEADLVIALGHVQGNPYGGFSGGYKTYTTGLTSWQSIAGHHVPKTMHRPDFLPVSPRSHFRSQLRAIGERIEERIAGQLFVIDAVVGRGARVLDVAAGSTAEVEAATWPLAERRTNVELDMPPADVVVFGLPRDFHYGPGMGTNPILVGQAIASTIARVAGALRPGGVVIAAALCDGWFNEQWFPSYESTFERYADVHSVADMGPAIHDICEDDRYVAAYRHHYAYHPFHAFSMLSMAELGRQYAATILVPGAQSPGHARAMGLVPTRTMSEALEKAERVMGKRPRILVLPQFLIDVPPHLFASREA